eukprot:1136455-Pelagomonas_calceolata.AAC.3
MFSSIAIALRCVLHSFGLPVMGLHTASILCVKARHTWFDLCMRALLGPQMPFFFILALNMCFDWKYVELAVGVRGIGAIQHAVQEGVGPYTASLVMLQLSCPPGQEVAL